MYIHAGKPSYTYNEFKMIFRRTITPNPQTDDHFDAGLE